MAEMMADDVPTTRSKVRSLSEALMRNQARGQPPPPTTKEERFLFPGVPVETFRKLQQVFVPKASDVFVASYPKNGTTWVQHIVSLIKNNGVDDGQDIDDKWLWYELFSADEVEVCAVYGHIVAHALFCSIAIFCKPL